MKVNISNAHNIIQEHGLVPSLWHYGYNIDVFYDTMEWNGTVLYASKQINKWSPIPVFSKSINTEAGGERTFWYLKLTTMDDFLARRSAKSSNPKKHFPSKETYVKTYEKIGGLIRIETYNKDMFIRDYDALRRKEHSDGHDLIKTMWATNNRLPLEWLRVARLWVDGKIVAIYLMVDDGRSYSDLNSAAILDNHGYCIYGLARLVDELCQRHYSSFDCGISGTYGGYKKKIFLDSVGVR